MSVFAPVPMASGWQQHHHLSSMSGGNTTSEHGLGLGIGRIQTSTLERPTLRSHRSFQDTLVSSPKHSMPPSQQTPLSSVNGQGGPVLQEHTQVAGQTTEQPHGGSASASPVQRVTPVIGDDNQDDSNDEDNFSDYEGSGNDDGENRTEQPERTAEQRRNDKRKMKRFRLTHSQTRFLMGEFARQAHPDAAQRERLSKEIPGLSPRQVQVWFQNRRAKLKRLTADDREKMMKSRALPGDFDVSQTLHSPFHSGMQQQSYPHHYTNNPIAHPAIYGSSHYGDANLAQPSIISNLRRDTDEDSTISSASMSSNFNNFYTPPGSSNTTGHISPISTTMDKSPFANFHYQPNRARVGQYNAPRSSSFSSGVTPQVPRMHIGHDRLATSRPEAVGSPLRASMSYGQNYDFTAHSAEESVPASNNSSILGARGYGADTSSYVRSGGFPYLNAQTPVAPPTLMRPNSTLPPAVDNRSSYDRSAYSYQQPSNFQSDLMKTITPRNQPLSLSQLQNQTTGNTQNSSQAPSMNYQTPPIGGNQEFHLPNPVDLYGSSYQSNIEQDNSNYGISNPSMQSDLHVDPESFYKAEHDIPARRSSVPVQPTIHTPQHELAQPQFPAPSSTGSLQTTQILQQQQSQHFGGMPATPRSASLKRPRDEGDDEEASRAGELGQDMGVASKRRRSFTLPGAYRPLEGMNPPQP